MDSLPEKVPQVTPWWRTEQTVSPMLLIAAGVGLLALGVAVGALLLR